MVNFIVSNALISGIRGVMSHGCTKGNFVAGGPPCSEVQNQQWWIQRLISWIAECSSLGSRLEHPEMVRWIEEKFHEEGFVSFAEAVLKFDCYQCQPVGFNIKAHHFELTVGENYFCESRLKINATMLHYSCANIKNTMLQAYLAAHRNSLTLTKRISLLAFNFNNIFLCGVNLTNCDLPDLNYTTLTGATLNQTTFGKVDHCILDGHVGLRSYKASRKFTSQLRSLAIKTALSEIDLSGYDPHLSALIEDYDHVGSSEDSSDDQALIAMLTSDDAILKHAWLFDVSQSELQRITAEMRKRRLTLDLSNVADRQYWNWKFQKESPGQHSGWRCRNYGRYVR